MGARLQARYTPTYLYGASSDFRDPFGFCQGRLHPLELTKDFPPGSAET